MEEKIKIDLTSTPWVKCEAGNLLWDSSMLFKKLSSLMSPSGKEELLPAEVIICKRCGKVPKFFWEKAKEIPDELKSNCSADESSLQLPSDAE
jgi:hypothetical protein